ncbi:helix-turn-helix domain-containing protein [Gracilibacillus lacisalsi]|uniref:helix-turn-helix domain-containing protein n=1 Tax=Gracilibacillus lacisalsi TaxID=393087 RepID=UPI00035D6734|nr:helix-turn-helix transcriptional regulator [Gracilibacillus lacisalsi]
MEDLNIGDKLKNRRKLLNLTTQEVAKRVNISQSYISRFENNRAIPDIDMLSRILKALDTDLPTFFSTQKEELPDDLVHLMETAKKLSHEERVKLTEFLKLIKK